MINEFKYGQTWKIWSSPLSVSLYSTFKGLNEENRYELWNVLILQSELLTLPVMGQF